MYLTQALNDIFAWIYFDELMWLAVVLDSRCSMAIKESWFRQNAASSICPLLKHTRFQMLCLFQIGVIDMIKVNLGYEREVKKQG